MLLICHAVLNFDSYDRNHPRFIFVKKVDVIITSNLAPYRALFLWIGGKKKRVDFRLFFRGFQRVWVYLEGRKQLTRRGQNAASGKRNQGQLPR